MHCHLITVCQQNLVCERSYLTCSHVRSPKTGTTGELFCSFDGSVQYPARVRAQHETYSRLFLLLPFYSPVVCLFALPSCFQLRSALSGTPADRSASRPRRVCASSLNPSPHQQSYGLSKTEMGGATLHAGLGELPKGTKTASTLQARSGDACMATRTTGGLQGGGEGAAQGTLSSLSEEIRNVDESSRGSPGARDEHREVQSLLYLLFLPRRPLFARPFCITGQVELRALHLKASCHQWPLSRSFQVRCPHASTSRPRSVVPVCRPSSSRLTL